MAACFGDNTLRRMLHGEIMHSGLSPESMNCTVDSLEIVDPATLLYLAEFIRIDQDASEQLDQFAILRQLDSIFSAPLLCMNKEEWEAEYEDVLKVGAVDLRQLRCLVKELGRENFERLIDSDYTPSLEVLILARIHRRRASGQCPEAARGCSCESGIMVLKQQSRPQNKEHPIDATTQPSRSHPNRV